MSPPRSPLRPFALAALALLWLATGCGDGDRADAALDASAPAERLPAPVFEHPDLDGHPVRLADLRGRTAVIDFWATWCAPCIFQPPELNRIFEAHREAGDVVVLGIEVSGASAEEIRAWGVDNEAVADYPILRGADDDLARAYGVHGFPALVVVDPEGRIASIHLGLITADEVEEAIAAAALPRG